MNKCIICIFYEKILPLEIVLKYINLIILLKQACVLSDIIRKFIRLKRYHFNIPMNKYKRFIKKIF